MLEIGKQWTIEVFHGFPMISSSTTVNCTQLNFHQPGRGSCRDDHLVNCIQHRQGVLHGRQLLGSRWDGAGFGRIWPDGVLNDLTWPHFIHFVSEWSVDWVLLVSSQFQCQTWIAMKIVTSIFRPFKSRKHIGSSCSHLFRCLLTHMSLRPLRPNCQLIFFFIASWSPILLTRRKRLSFLAPGCLRPRWAACYLHAASPGMAVLVTAKSRDPPWSTTYPLVI